MAQPSAQPCNGCGGGAVTYDAAPAQVMPMAAPADNGTILNSAPAAVEVPATEGSVIVPNADGANNARPVVDPSAFVIKK